MFLLFDDNLPYFGRGFGSDHHLGVGVPLDIVLDLCDVQLDEERILHRELELDRRLQVLHSAANQLLRVAVRAVELEQPVRK